MQCSVYYSSEHFYIGTTLVSDISTDGALIALSGLNCTGTENKLIDCPHFGFGNHDCTADQAAGLYCGSKSYIIVLEFALFATSHDHLVSQAVLPKRFYVLVQKMTHNVSLNSTSVMK